MKKESNISNFKVPESYFETFEEQLFSKISEEEFPKSNGFKVPEDYFEDLEDRVLKSVRNSEEPIKTIPLIGKKYLGFAAAIAACLVIGFTILNNRTDKQNLDTIQLAAIDSYIEEGNLNFDFYDLTTMINDSDISGFEVQKRELSQSALEDYLFENIDTEILINER